MNHRRHPVLALLLLAGSFGVHAADTPSGEEFSTGAGYEAPGTYSNDPYAQPQQQQAPQQAPGGWSGQSAAPSNGGYGASGNAYGAGGGGYGGSQGYGGGQAAGGIQGGSFKGRGQTQGGGTTNAYSSGKTFTKKPKTNVDASAFGGGTNSSNTGGSTWPDAGYETPAPSPSPY